MKTVAVIQARMTSSRLPGKVLMPLAGRPLLQHVVDRASRASRLDAVVVATTDRPSDDRVADFCRENGVGCFRGSENDVLDRYYQAARTFDVQTIVRLTADCPLLDPLVIDKTIQAFFAGDCDYASNAIRRTYPDGLDAEVFRREALELAWREARLTSEREHVTPYIWKHPELFRLVHVANDVDYSEMRWTVDEPRDLEFVKSVFDHFGTSTDFGMADILALLREHPELGRINSSIPCNEGYEKSLQEDSIVND
jgi:spore coat polysaccharide biosynthesis protein SpsF